ncbi:MAG: signal peptidase I [Proteobacteria bacterium]|nr:signal peptidase I [Pseudomonadota bacterium]MCZ6783663.1 signal peptidase I [Pseudomonadota bacterium]
MSDRVPETESAEEEPKSAGQKVWEQVSTLLFAVLIALAIRAFVIEPFRIPSGSMLPTLLIGDHLFVNKFIYGIKIPFTDIRLPGLREPERGDVVVFKVARNGDRIVPADRRPDLPKDDFVKRIVGLPGDRMEVRDGVLTVNGVVVTRVDTGETFEGERGGSLRIHYEQLNGCRHIVLDDPRQTGLPRSPFTVPPGRYFMMGDNRDHSNDSRKWGTVRFEELKGPAFLLYWSWDVNGSFLQFLNPINWFTAEKRWERVFSRVKCDDSEPGVPVQASD